MGLTYKQRPLNFRFADAHLYVIACRHLGPFSNGGCTIDSATDDSGFNALAITDGRLHGYRIRVLDTPDVLEAQLLALLQQGLQNDLRPPLQSSGLRHTAAQSIRQHGSISKVHYGCSSLRVKMSCDILL